MKRSDLWDDVAWCVPLSGSVIQDLSGSWYSGPRFNEVAGDRPNLFLKWRARYIENLDITNLRGKDQNVHYTEVIVND